jgi:uncharacterized protein
MKVILIGMVRLYKTYVSPFLPSACRFEPTCSEYAMEAMQKHGSLRGSGIAIYRVLRCQPFAKGGYDPVP